MRVISQLPLDESSFLQIERMPTWPYVWQHQSISRIRVCSHTENPWDREWEIKISEQKSKRGGVKVTNRIDLECHDIDLKWNHPKAEILINEERGIFKTDDPCYIIPGASATFILLIKFK